jgi:rRNA-processing protein FCF1
MEKLISHESNSGEIFKKNRRFVLLDSSFILTCAKQKIDFFEFLETSGIQILIPEQVINEIKKISDSKEKLHFKDDAELALIILGKHKNKFKKIDLEGKNVDNAIINFAKKNQDIIIATLDRKIKTSLKNKKLLIRGKKKLELR